MVRRLTTSEFITKANRIHNDQYDYSLVDYKRSSQKVIIVCKSHGVFEQRPNNHLQGKGCETCASASRSITRTLSLPEIVHRFAQQHNGVYDYRYVDYIGQHDKIKIICRAHGPFMQTPHSHQSGRGCPQCGDDAISHQQTMSLDQILNRFSETHGNKYDYSLVVYRKQIEKVIIICRNHGQFKQSPVNHMRGAGCPKCAKHATKGTKLYLIEFESTSEHFGKVGIMKNTVDERFSGWRSHGILTVHAVIEQENLDNARSLESTLLSSIPDDQRIQPNILKQKWRGWTEAFEPSLIPDILQMINT